MIGCIICTFTLSFTVGIIVKAYIYIAEMPILSEKDQKENQDITKYLGEIYPEEDHKYAKFKPNGRFLLHYFGSTWNPFVWFLPI